ncbi:hypothetical protein KR51_00029620 [Rubidibacter lacunae KORDI 51-2]|uniref:DUF4326 domain-containing protein n=1 Tax=Rubidibacter lacunae KORDI 51-2 TaxID=582515 RepID=U5DGK6_9CHRO|nr:hypothetical protein KR51_00029620 [Rubidibacter lacunae KORDI 51-2]
MNSSGCSHPRNVARTGPPIARVQDFYKLSHRQQGILGTRIQYISAATKAALGDCREQKHWQREAKRAAGSCDPRRCHRRSDLGNPFDLQGDERLRQRSVECYRIWLKSLLRAAIRGRGHEVVAPIAIVHDKEFACDEILETGYPYLAPSWKQPTSEKVVYALLGLLDRLRAGDRLQLNCHCKLPGEDRRCHADVIVGCLEWIAQHSDDRPLVRRGKRQQSSPRSRRVSA